jgi:hypothetical protein
MFVEPILDHMGGVWWPVHGSWEAFNLVGINIPLLVCFVYPWLLGSQAYLTYRLFERGMTPRKLWYLVGIFAINDVVLETIGVKVLRVYAYFGQQPLNLWGLPLWYVPCNAIGPVVVLSPPRPLGRMAHRRRYRTVANELRRRVRGMRLSSLDCA